MKVNLLKVEERDFKTWLQHAGTKLKVNNKPRTVSISNLPITVNGEFDDKYISSADLIKRGDHFKYNDIDYYIISQVATKRYESYKGIARCAEYSIKFNVSEFDAEWGGGAYTSYKVYNIPCIVQTTKTFGLGNSDKVLLPDGEVAIYFQDNQYTREIYDSFVTDNSGTSHNFIIAGLEYTYIGFDLTQQGLIRLNAKLTTKTEVDQYGVVWRVNSDHSSYKGEMFNLYNEPIEIKVEEPPIEPEPEPEPEPVDPNRTYTDVGTITYTTVPATDGIADGQITFSWTADPLATQGYYLRLKRHNYPEFNIEATVTDTTYTFTGLAESATNEYYLIIQSKTDTGTLGIQQSDDVYIGSNSGWGSW